MIGATLITFLIDLKERPIAAKSIKQYQIKIGFIAESIRSIVMVHLKSELKVHVPRGTLIGPTFPEFTKAFDTA